MKNRNASPARWVGWFALLCAFLALITPAGKQAVHIDHVDESPKYTITCRYEVANSLYSSEREERKLQDMRPIWLLQA
jgi:hypothetical protein